jgi:hypothetical protein
VRRDCAHSAKRGRADCATRLTSETACRLLHQELKKRFAPVVAVCGVRRAIAEAGDALRAGSVICHYFFTLSLR